MVLTTTSVGARWQAGPRLWPLVGAIVAGALALAACSDGDVAEDGDANEDQEEAANDVETTDDGEGDAAAVDGSDEPVTGGVVRVDWIAEPPSLDPLRFNSLGTFFTYTLVYDTVVTFEDGDLVPQLASDLPTVSEDGLTYEIPVRGDVTFHDGSELTAEDVAHTIDVVRDPENGSIWYSALADVDTVEVEGDTVVVQLAEPYAPLLGMLARIYIISSEEEYLPDESLATTMNGTGPFQFESWDQGSMITLERNDDYYGGEGPYLDGIEIHILPEDATRVANVANGVSQVMPKVPYDQISVLEDEGITVNVVDDSIIMPTIWPSFGDGRPTADVDVRRAIAQAIDRGQIVEQVYQGFAVPTSTFMASGMPYWDEEIGSTFGAGADLDAAEASLDAAEVTIDEPLELIHRAEPAETALATIVQSNLADLGIELTLSAEEAASYFPKLVSGDFDLMLLSVEGGPSAANTMHTEYGALYSTSTANYHGFVDEEMDRLLEEAVGTPDDPEAAWNAVQERDLEILPYIPVVTARYAEAVRDELEGYDTSEMINLRNLEHAWLQEP